ncbi:MAG: GNAT family N-acetyltransferase [Anaerolineales bacterium]|nr:MAG: GNAT family N-acetyltransferase [Anaerolineales bacterium]
MNDPIPNRTKRVVEVRTAELRDFFKLQSLEKSCFQADAWPWIDILAALTFPDTVRLVAECEDGLVGFVIGDRRQRRDMGWIASIAVHPEHRRQGFGAELLAGCERALRTSRVRLSLRPSNTGALELYRKLGYVEVDRWRRYYRDGEDALVMEKQLT